VVSHVTRSSSSSKTGSSGFVWVKFWDFKCAGAVGGCMSGS
jgi:hypothetical protein